MVVRSGCVLSGGGVEPSEDEIEGDEGGLSGWVMVGSC